MSDLQDAIHRAIPVMREERSGAMYETKTSADIEGYAVDVADWRTITKAARRIANPDTFAAKQAFPHVDAADVVGIVDAALGITEDE